MKYQMKVEAEKKTTEKKHPTLRQWLLEWQNQTKLRHQHEERLRAIEQGRSNLDKELEEYFFHAAEALEKTAKDRMVWYCKAEMPEIFEWLCAIKGIADWSAAKLLAFTDDIGGFEYVSSMWKRWGYGLGYYWVNGDGKRVAPCRGYTWDGPKGKKKRYLVVPDPEPGWVREKMIDKGVEKFERCYIQEAKTMVWIICSDSFIRQKTPLYYPLYIDRKAKELEKGLKLGHADNRAKRWMAKLFLSHYYTRYREIEGYPPSKPYSHDHLGHTGLIEPI